METHIAHLPASRERLQMYQAAQQSDPVYQILTQYCHDGWPGKHSVDPAVKPYWEKRGELTIGKIFSCVVEESLSHRRCKQRPS